MSFTFQMNWRGRRAEKRGASAKPTTVSLSTSPKSETTPSRRSANPSIRAAQMIQPGRPVAAPGSPTRTANDDAAQRPAASIVELCWILVLSQFEIGGRAHVANSRISKLRKGIPGLPIP